MNSIAFQHNKKVFMLVLALVAAISSVVISIAYFTDRANRTTTVQTATFDAKGYELARTEPDGYLTSGETAEILLKESNNKSEDISSQITLTASWDSPVPDVYPWGNSNAGNIQISLDGEDVSYTENKEDNTISFTLPENALSTSASDIESTLLFQIPSDLAATGALKISFDQIVLRSGKWTYECEKDTLTALDFTADVAWNISKDQITAMDNPNRDVLAFLEKGTSKEEYTLNIIKNGSDTNTNYGQMTNWTAKEQTPWARYDITDLSLSEGVTTIGCYAFAGETGITNLSLPSTVNTIGSSAFEGSGLSGELVIPSTVMIIESLAFGELPDVNEITFEHGSDDSLILPDNTSEGEETSGAFYVSGYVKTTLNFNGNTVAEQYDWVADQRMKIGISEVSLSYDTIQAGKTTDPVLIINPSNYDEPQSIKYSIIEGEDNASIDPETGVVTGIAAGSAKIQLTIVDANGEAIVTTSTIWVNSALGDVQVGDTVYLNENGSPVEYLVVNQGIPSDSNRYDSSCDGTWLLRKDIHSVRNWTSALSNDYSESAMHSYLNDTFLNLFDTDTQNAIKQAVIPYISGSGAHGSAATGANGLSTKIFLLSVNELGYTQSGLNNVYLHDDSACLTYFAGSTSQVNAKCIAYLDGTATTWWTRSPYAQNAYYAWGVATNGYVGYHTTNTSYLGVRPALILPKDAIINGDGSVSVDHLILDSVSVTKQPDKTVYMEGEDFDPTGMEVTVTYKDGSTKTASIDDLTIENGTDLSVDQTEISIYYTDNGHTVDVTVPITVEKKPIAMEDAEIGSTVILDVDGSPTEFIIVHQGNPDSSLYDASCDGTWLLMKDIYELRQWHSKKTNWYASSTIHSYLNSSFLSLLDTDIQQTVVQAKIPYATGENNNTTVASGSSGLSTKVFLLSCYEVGWTNIDLDTFPVDGASLSYFKNTSQTDSKRIAYFGNKAYLWWLRSPLINEGDYAVSCSNTGWWDFSPCTNSNGIRPALIMPSDAIINGDGTVDVSNLPVDITSPPSQKDTLTYTGKEQTVTWNNYDSTQLTISGTTSASEAGTYTATFTPNKGYQWSDGTTEAKEVTWTIGKATGSLSLSSTSVDVNQGKTQTVTATRSGDGTISAKSSDTSVATVSVEGTKITITGVSSGSASITVSVAAGTNHKAPSNETVSVTVITPVSNLSTGSSVFLNVDGKPTEFLVVHQGIPDTTMYDSSCNGTWLLMKDIYETRQWDENISYNDYSISTIHSYLNNTFITLFDADIQSAIKEVKIPYYNRFNLKGEQTGVNGLSTKVFLLCAYEVGATGTERANMAKIGTKLDYFESGGGDEENITTADTKRLAYFNGSATTWWLRGQMTTSSNIVTQISKWDGLFEFGDAQDTAGVRPALILPSDCTVDADGFIATE